MNLELTGAMGRIGVTHGLGEPFDGTTMHIVFH